ncbi:MAG: hypothetical protein HYV27_09220 [Candidatus Hydrogenedentes bacterium]|nr:hypothetical protein [Candidatus Hydrogenedentota bacterium]
MSMLSLTIPFLVVTLITLWRVVRVLSDAWFDHRMRLNLLSQLERNPRLKEESTPFKEALTAPISERQIAARREFAAIGIALVLSGCVCIGVGLALEPERWGTGIYLGGIVAIVFGFVLTVVSVLLLYLHRGREFGSDNQQ